MSWKKVKLGDFCEVVTKGTTPTTLGKSFVDRGIPFVRIQNIRYGTVVFDEDTLYIDESTDKLLSRSRIKANDVLISIAGTIGRSAIVPANTPPLNCNQAIAIIRVANSIEPKFLNYWLSSQSARKQIFGAKVTATISNLSLGRIRELTIPLPPLPVQRHIAAVLDKADALRRKRRRALDKLDEMLQAVFLDMFGDPVTNPKGWPTKKLEALIKDGPQNGLYRPSSDYGNGVPIVRIDSFYAGEIKELDNLKRLRIDAETISKYLIQEGEILINRVNSRKFLGKSALVPALHEPTVFESNMMRIAVDENLISPVFLVALLQHDYIKMQIMNRCKDAVNQSSINQTDVKSLEIRVPSIAWQHSFVQRKEQLRAIQNRFMCAVDRLDLLFNALMQKAFKGELTFASESVASMEQEAEDVASQLTLFG